MCNPSTIAQLFTRRIIKDKQERIMAEYMLHIDGMHCGSCVKRVTQALNAVEGVVVNEVRVGAARLTSSQNPAPIDLAVAALAKAGFTAHLEA
jgi:copper chaperone CopZ